MPAKKRNPVKRTNNKKVVPVAKKIPETMQNKKNRTKCTSLYQESLVEILWKGLNAQNPIWRKRFKNKKPIKQGELKSLSNPGASFKQMKKDWGSYLEKYYVIPRHPVEFLLYSKDILRTVFHSAAGKENVQLFRNALRHDRDLDAKIFALGVLRLWKDKQSVKPMMGLLKNPETETSLRIACARAMWKLKGKNESIELKKMLNSKFKDDVLLAQIALSRNRNAYGKRLAELRKSIFRDIE